MGGGTKQVGDGHPVTVRRPLGTPDEKRRLRAVCRLHRRLRLCQASLQEPVPALRDVRKAFGRHQAVCHSKLVHVLRSRL